MTGGGGSGGGGGGGSSSGPTSTPAPQPSETGNTYKQPQAGVDKDGNPVNENGDRLPASIVDPTPNTHPGSGYAERRADGYSTNRSNNGTPMLGDPKWIPEVGAGDKKLREAQTIDAIVDRLTEKYKDRNWDFTPLKNADYDANIESIREAAQAFDDMMTKHPYRTFKSNQPLRAVLHRDYADVTGYASVKSYSVGGVKTYTESTDYIAVAAVGTDRMRNTLHGMYSNDQNKSDTRNYNLDAMNRPAYYTIVHEMGHNLDHTGRGRAQPRVRDFFIEDMKENSPKLDAKYGEYVDRYGEERGTKMYEKWLEENLEDLVKEWMAEKLVSDYSYNRRIRSSGPFITEAIAEAFLDVEIRGDKANEYSKKIYEILVEEAKKGANP